MQSGIITENKAYWSDRASSYSEVNRSELDGHSKGYWMNTLCHEIDTAVGKPRDRIKVLEVGTGPGFFAIILSQCGYNVTAVDLTPAMLKEALHNAGAEAKKIDFREMNAEALDFPDNSFDVVVSRNLTWNLPHPENAYAEWCRVLVPDGVLLNFDANWYSYLFDDAAMAAYEQDRQNSMSAGIADQNIGENFDIMENIARRIPLSSVRRPAWDIASLSSLGMSVTADCEVWKRVWTHEEKINFASTPMFMISAKKS